MNIDDGPIDGLDQLDTPPPRTGFWDDLHQALLAQATPRESIEVEDGSVAAIRLRVDRGRRRRYLAAIAAVVVAFVGLAAIVKWRDTSTSVPASPSTGDIVISDPMAINLDPWATNPPDTAPGPFTVFDVDTLPAGWQGLGTAYGYHDVGDPDPSHYRWAAKVTSDDGRQVFLSADAPLAIGTQDGTAVTVHGEPGNANNDRLAWADPSGVGLTVISPDASPEQLVALADALQITTIGDLPAGDLAQPTDQPASGTLRLAGFIAGTPWSITSADDATTGLSLNINQRIRGSSSGIPRKVVTTWDVNIAGLGDSGTIIYGLAPADVTQVRVDLGSQTARLPVTHDDTGVAVYAIPIAPGLRVRQLDLLTADGVTRQHVTFPRILTPTASYVSYSGQPLNNGFPKPPGATQAKSSTPGTQTTVAAETTTPTSR